MVQIESNSAENKISVSEILKFVLGWVENIVEKRENAGHQHSLLFSARLIKRLFFFKVRKSRDYVVKV